MDEQAAPAERTLRMARQQVFRFRAVHRTSPGAPHVPPHVPPHVVIPRVVEPGVRRLPQLGGNNSQLLVVLANPLRLLTSLLALLTPAVTLLGLVPEHFAAIERPAQRFPHRRRGPRDRPSLLRPRRRLAGRVQLLRDAPHSVAGGSLRPDGKDAPPVGRTLLRHALRQGEGSPADGLPSLFGRFASTIAGPATRPAHARCAL